MKFLAEQISQKLNQSADNLIVSLDNKKFYKIPMTKTVKQFGLNEDGVKLFVKLIDQNQQQKKTETD